MVTGKATAFWDVIASLLKKEAIEVVQCFIWSPALGIIPNTFWL